MNASNDDFLLAGVRSDNTTLQAFILNCISGSIDTEVINLSNGTVSDPSITFNSSSGVYSTGTNNVSVSINDTQALSIGDTAIQLNKNTSVPILSIGDGTNSAPTLRFSTSPNTGLYLFNTNSLALTVAGSTRMDLSATRNRSWNT